MVSVWMITYNHERFISQAIESVLAQDTGFDYELVIGEDCSTDRTRDIVLEFQRRYPTRIRLLLQQENVGAGANAFDVLQACRGKYIAMLEGDDYWTDPQKLQLQVELMEANPAAFMCGARARVWREGEPGPLGVLPAGESEVLASYGARELYRSQWWFRTCTKLVPRRLMQSVPSRFDHDWAWNLWLVAATRFGPMCFLDREVAVYREHSGGEWSALSEAARLERDVATLYALIPHFEKADRQYLVELMGSHVSRLLGSAESTVASRLRSTAMALIRNPGKPESWRRAAESLRRAF